MIIELVALALTSLVFLEVSYLLYLKLRGYSTRSNTAVYVDTSVLIDGRIIDLVATGFMPGDLVIPRSVIRELQLLADGTDHDKREKARRGLDVVRHLQEADNISVEILADELAIPEGVDERLIKLSQRNGGKLLTIDYNLNKVAQVEGVTVLNINDLAKQLRMSFLPGDRLALELTQVGSNAKQAVGYLADGTMVVVEQAKQKLGQTVKVEITRSLQTSAGRMMFARIIEATPVSDDKKAKQPKPIVSPSPKREVIPKRLVATPKSNGRKPRYNTSASHEDALVRLANANSGGSANRNAKQ